MDCEYCMKKNRKIILSLSTVAFLTFSSLSVWGGYKYWDAQFPRYLDLERYEQQPIGIATWCYSGYTDTAEEIIGQCDKYNITTLFLSASPNRLTPAHELYNETYEINFRLLLSMAADRNISIHVMTGEWGGFWHPDTYDSLLYLVEYFLNFSRDNPHLPIAGVHTDVEYYGEEGDDPWNWDAFWDGQFNQRNYDISNGFMEQSRLLSNLIRNHNSEYNQSIRFSTATGWFQHESALQGLINGTFSQLNEYYDFLVPMHAEMKYTPRDLYNSMRDEVSIMPIVVGMGSVDYDDFSTLARDINELNVRYEGSDTSANFLGICMYSYEYLITLELP